MLSTTDKWRGSGASSQRPTTARWCFFRTISSTRISRNRARSCSAIRDLARSCAASGYSPGTGATSIAACCSNSLTRISDCSAAVSATAACPRAATPPGTCRARPRKSTSGRNGGIAPTRPARAIRCPARWCWKGATSSSRTRKTNSRRTATRCSRSTARCSRSRCLTPPARLFTRSNWPRSSMPIDRKLELVRDRAVRALGNHRGDQAVAKIRAIIGPQSIPNSEPLAQSALDKLHRGEVPSADELAALEIVVRLLRPVVFSHDGVLDDLPDRPDQNLQPQDLKDLWTTFRNSVQPFIGSIGRIETKSGTHVGTGFLVAENALATNRHVLGALTFGSEVLEPAAARVVFRQEHGRTNKPGDIVSIDGVLAMHPRL